MRLALIFVFGLVLRLGLIAKFPMIFGGDSMLRMIQRDRIFISHQLPLLQLVVFATARFTHNYLITMIVMAVIGASVGAAFYAFALGHMPESPAFWAALLIATNPFITGDSIVPFQESLMLALLLFVFHFQQVGRISWTSVFLGLACLTRFEAWAAVPVFAAAFVFKQGPNVRNVLRASAMFGWAPLAWILFQRGLAPPGSYVVESHLTLARFMRWVYLGYITVKFTPVIVIALGLFGLWIFWRDRWIVQLWPCVVFIGLFTVAVLFSAHGDLPDPERRVSAREATLWIASMLLLAAIALNRIRYCAAVGAVGVLFGVWGSYQFVEQEAADPHLALSYRLARFFDGALQPGERALVLAPPWPHEVFDFYLQRARETGGIKGYEAAVRSLADSEMSPPAYQRMLIHSRFDRSRILSTPDGCTEWLAVWSDSGSTPEPPRTILRQGDLSVSISRHTCSR
jgi:hypothetical protein